MSIYEDKFVVGNTVGFTTYIPAIVGANYVSSEVLGILGYKSARLINPAIDVIHTTGLSKLPVGTSPDPKALTYVQLENKDGSISVLAFDWINPDTITIDGVTQYSIIIGGATPDKLTKLRRFATIELGLAFNSNVM